MLSKGRGVTAARAPYPIGDATIPGGCNSVFSITIYIIIIIIIIYYSDILIY